MACRRTPRPESQGSPECNGSHFAAMPRRAVGTDDDPGLRNREAELLGEVARFVGIRPRFYRFGHGLPPGVSERGTPVEVALRHGLDAAFLFRQRRHLCPFLGIAQSPAALTWSARLFLPPESGQDSGRQRPPAGPGKLANSNAAFKIHRHRYRGALNVCFCVRARSCQDCSISRRLSAMRTRVSSIRAVTERRSSPGLRISL